MMDRGLQRQRGELEGFSRRACGFCKNPSLTIDYKDPQTLRYFLSDRGKIVPRRVSGTCAKHQRAITRAINRARNVALLPFTTNT